ncbi:16840_t:CDS:2 [Rhizophagus irregularis]|nr:16840_t:CDS:2 [Rhizophagus irregularis]
MAINVEWCKEFTPDIEFAKNLLDELDWEFVISTKYLADLMFILTKSKLPSFIKSFSEAIINSIKSRFPQSDLYHSFRIFDLKLSPIKENELGNYGNDDIKKLSDYYGVDKMDDEGNIVEKIINGDNVKQEWKFPNISKLIKISLIVPLSNAQVERIFSQHKLTKTRLRNRMNIESLNKHLMILLNGPDNFRRFDWNKAYDYWAMKVSN